MGTQTLVAEEASELLTSQEPHLPFSKDNKPKPSEPSPFEMVAISLRNLREGLQSVVEGSLFHEPTRMGLRASREPEIDLSPLINAGLRTSKLCEDLFLAIRGNSEGVMEVRQVLAQTHLSIQRLLISFSELPSLEVTPGDIMDRVAGEIHNTSAALAESIIFMEAVGFRE